MCSRFFTSTVAKKAEYLTSDENCSGWKKPMSCVSSLCITNGAVASFFWYAVTRSPPSVSTHAHKSTWLFWAPTTSHERRGFTRHDARDAGIDEHRVVCAERGNGDEVSGGL